jgi:hypothetical protein
MIRATPGVLSGRGSFALVDRFGVERVVASGAARDLDVREAGSPPEEAFVTAGTS